MSFFVQFWKSTIYIYSRVNISESVINTGNIQANDEL